MSAPKPSPEELERLITGIVGAVGEAAALTLLDCHRTTLMRWRTGKACPPATAIALLRIWAEGRLPGMGPEWDGFRMMAGKLTLPNGVAYGPRDLTGFHWKEQNYECQDRRVQQLEKLVYDLTARLQVHSGAANDVATNPTNPPPRPKMRTA